MDPIQVLASAIDRHEDEEAAHDEAERIVRASPPWVISFLWHVAVLVFLGFLFFPGQRRDAFELEATFSDTLGEQLDDMVSLSVIEDPDIEQAIIMEEEWEPVDDPLASLPVLDIPIQDDSAVASLVAPTIGVSLQGRDAGMKQALLKAYGGTALTEDAVKQGLAWLKRRQQRNGSWSLVGPYSQGGSTENEIAATAMAVLAFQGAGHTTETGTYQAEVSRAWKWLLARQDKQGCFYERVPAMNHRFYTHALATIAICELLGMTRDESLREPGQQAIDYLVETQDALGGWRYTPGSGSDLSVTGWVTMALQSGRMAGLVVPSPVFERIAGFLDRVQEDYGARYGYLPRDAATISMTAEGLLCRQYLGWPRDHAGLRAGAEYLADNPIQWRDPNLYYWYYATQVLHHMEGDVWTRWNAVLRKELPQRQEKVGPEKGSWHNTDDRFSLYGGRLYSTCLCLYMLEVYYRHMPIYAKVYDE